MTKQLTIPASYIQTMLNQAEQRGMKRSSLLKDIKLDMADLEANRPCSALAYGQLHHRITQSIGDDWFGMLSGGSVPPGAIKLLCRLAVDAKTLADVITRSAEFFEICRGFKVKQTIIVQESVVVSRISKLDDLSDQEFDQLMARVSPGIIKSTLAAWHGFLSWSIGQEIPLKTMFYSFSADQCDDIKHRYIIRYDESFCGYSYDAKYLHMPVIQQEDNIDDFIGKAPYYAFIRNARNSDSVIQRVKSLMAKAMGDSFPQAQEVAQQLNMSVTTLHRKLGQEGGSFQKLKDETRMEAAIHYLSSPDISAVDVAALLGFEDPSTFYRSFKKWTSLPPGEYRKQLQASSEAL